MKITDYVEFKNIYLNDDYINYVGFYVWFRNILKLLDYLMFNYVDVKYNFEPYDSIKPLFLNQVCDKIDKHVQDENIRINLKNILYEQSSLSVDIKHFVINKIK